MGHGARVAAELRRAPRTAAGALVTARVGGCAPRRAQIADRSDGRTLRAAARSVFLPLVVFQVAVSAGQTAAEPVQARLWASAEGLSEERWSKAFAADGDVDECVVSDSCGDDVSASPKDLALYQSKRPVILRTGTPWRRGDPLLLSSVRQHMSFWPGWLEGTRLQITKWSAPTYKSAIVAASILGGVVLGMCVCSLHSGSCCLCFVRKGTRPSLATKAATLFATLTCLTLASVLVLHLFAGAVLQKLIEHYDVSFLGTEVTIEHLELHPFRGIVDLRGLVVANPAGYKSDHLLRADEVRIEVAMLPLILSAARTIPISSLDMRGADLYYEQSWTTSNVEDVIRNLKQHTALLRFTPQVDGRKVALHRVKISGVHARAATSFALSLGLTLWLADISYDDFEQQAGSSAVDEIVVVLYESLLSSVLKAFKGG